MNQGEQLIFATNADVANSSGVGEAYIYEFCEDGRVHELDWGLEILGKCLCVCYWVICVVVCMR